MDTTYQLKKTKIMQFSTRANGKLLLTGEYFVTEGATALALPTRFGQRLIAQDGEEAGILHWQSYDHDGTCWFDGKFSLDDFSVIHASGDEDASNEVAEQLQVLLMAIRKLNPNFLTDLPQGVQVATHLDFPRIWGLGSSSTLVTMLAQWAKVNPFDLLDNTFKGSGYDIAAATAPGPILYRRFNGKPQTEISNFNPSFRHQLYFVHLNQKQDSREALVYYMVTPQEQREVPLPRISQITFNVAQYSETLEEFEELLEEHEELVQSIVQQPRAKEQYFSDFWGEVKSLGAWGGDFVLVTSNEPEEKTRQYFAERGFETVLSYDEMVLA